MTAKTIADLAAELRRPVAEVIEAAAQLESYAERPLPFDPLSTAEQADVRAILDPTDVDGAPQHQYRATDGAPDTPWQEWDV